MMKLINRIKDNIVLLLPEVIAFIITSVVVNFCMQRFLDTNKNILDFICISLASFLFGIIAYTIPSNIRLMKAQGALKIMLWAIFCFLEGFLIIGPISLLLESRAYEAAVREHYGQYTHIGYLTDTRYWYAVATATYGFVGNAVVALQLKKSK